MGTPLDEGRQEIAGVNGQILFVAEFGYSISEPPHEALVAIAAMRRASSRIQGDEDPLLAALRQQVLEKTKDGELREKITISGFSLASLNLLRDSLTQFDKATQADIDTMETASQTGRRRMEGQTAHSMALDIESVMPHTGTLRSSVSSGRL